MNPGITISPLPSANDLLEGHPLVLWNENISLNTSEPQVGQRHEDVKMKWEYYHIIIFPERT